MDTFHFGEHLTIDGYGGSASKLDDKNYITKVFLDLPKELGMHCLSDIQVYHTPGNSIKDPGGWSGFIVIEESHISLHTFPLRGFISADVYTCRNGLDINKIITYFSNYFELKSTETNFIIRGKNYPSTNIY